MIKNFFTRFCYAAVDLFYPPQCILCNKNLSCEETYLCSECRNNLPLIIGARCPKCSRPIKTKNGENILCGACRIAPNKYLDIIVAAGEYHGRMKQLVHSYKYDRHQFLAKIFAEIISEQIYNSKLINKFDILAPIPLHWTRKRWRGFNQAREICRQLEKIINVPVAKQGAIKRIKKTTPQVQLNAASRAANIKNAFKIIKPATFKNKNIALVDDVFTTGSTSNECAKILLKSGAKSVSLLIIAR